MKLTSYLAGTPQVRGRVAGNAFWVTGVLSTGRKRRIFRRRAFFFTCSLWPGLHVGALAFCRSTGWEESLGLSRVGTMLFTLTILGAYVAVVEQRAFLFLRAALMAAMGGAWRIFSSGDWNCSIPRRWQP